MYWPSGEYAASKPQGIGNCVGIPPSSGTVNNCMCRLLNTYRLTS